jgi:hypothetical protein
MINWPCPLVPRISPIKCRDWQLSWTLGASLGKTSGPRSLADQRKNTCGGSPAKLGSGASFTIWYIQGAGIWLIGEIGS